jgi:hypothetical protein
MFGQRDALAESRASREVVRFYVEAIDGVEDASPRLGLNGQGSRLLHSAMLWSSCNRRVARRVNAVGIGDGERTSSNPDCSTQFVPVISLVALSRNQPARRFGVFRTARQDNGHTCTLGLLVRLARATAIHQRGQPDLNAGPLRDRFESAGSVVKWNPQKKQSRASTAGDGK